jgi:LPXTG-site transpeptidase (sortase) family protein
MDQNNSYLIPENNRKKRIEPSNPAVDMIRYKLEALYEREPNARQEMVEAKQAQPPRSKHQEFMYRLSTSGRRMEEIQAAWHDYYAKLPDHEKHEVWQEFYSQHAHARQEEARPPTEDQNPVVISHEMPVLQAPRPDRRSPASIKKQILSKIKSNRIKETKAKKHLQSLFVGLTTGILVLLIGLFGLFNELVIIPFIRPAAAGATPIILSSDAPAPSADPELIIPKINAQLPVIYGAQSVAEKDIQRALEGGVFHYPTTAVPGQNGNAAYFGHSSNNIFNKGNYKFAFLLLKELEPGDIFYQTYQSKVYTYKVFKKQIVNPDETWVLGPVEGKAATSVLITCDPPGTTLRRLVVWGEQISPDPTVNSAAVEPSPALMTQDLPGKEPNFIVRFWRVITPF